MMMMSHRQRHDARFQIIRQVLEAIRALVHNAPGTRCREETPNSCRFARKKPGIKIGGGVGVENAATADEDANGNGETNDGGGVVRDALAERVERVEKHVRD